MVIGWGENGKGGIVPLAIPLTDCHQIQRIYLILSHSLQSSAVPYHSATREVTSRHGKKQEGEGAGLSGLCLGTF